MGVKLNVVGKIDLDALNQSAYRSIDPNEPFKVISIKVAFGEQEPLILDFGEIGDDNPDEFRYFSLFIGKNGLGKSMLLCEIIDFMVDASKGEYIPTRKYVNILSMAYTMGGRLFEITREDNGEFTYRRDKRPATFRRIEFPLIIASTMGMFDKFPLNSYSWKKGYYNVDFYRYVGPKANSNLYSTKTNLMFQMLGNLRDLKRKQQMTKVSKILNFIGYESKLMVKFKIRASSSDNNSNSKKVLKTNAQAYYDSLKPGALYEETIDFERDTMPHVRQIQFREISEMKQKGYLAAYECYLYQNGSPIECNHLSSGEFNMLSMVMSVVLTSRKSHLLILLDEPEISHHPNWQMEIIDNLDDALSDYKCHFMIATHSHFLVSDLPIGRSNVMDIERNEEGQTEITPLLAETYGWSAEEVLLKAFKMPTDRNKYLAEVVGELMRGIADKSIDIHEVSEKLDFLKKVKVHLSDVDPMKKIIETILGTFERYE